METTAPGPVAGAPVTRVESLGRHAGFWQSSPPRISVRQCLDYCIQWYGPCNSPSDLWALDCKINRDRCEARCFGR
jgi:hypothetical protein